MQCSDGGSGRDGYDVDDDERVDVNEIGEEVSEDVGEAAGDECDEEIGEELGEDAVKDGSDEQLEGGEEVQCHAVSYTHLDVYKRQYIGCLPGEHVCVWYIYIYFFFYVY